MGNPYSKLLNSPEIQDIKARFTLEELQILSRIYTDLSARDYGVISKETFLHFFGLTGIWGERIFEIFDTKHTESIGFASFLRGLAKYCKCTEEDKIKLLFALYDIDNDGLIQRKELITMLYNFPKHYLKEIIDEAAADGGERLERFNEDKRKMTMTNIDIEIEPAFRGDTTNMLVSPLVPRRQENQEKSIDISEHIIAEEGTDEVVDNILYRNLKAPRFGHLSTEAEAQETNPTNPLQMWMEKAVMDGLGMQDKQSVQPRTPKRTTAPSLEVPMPRVSNIKKTSMEREFPSTNKINEDYAKGELSAASLYSRNRMSTVMLDQSYAVATTLNARVKEYAANMFRNCEGAQKTGKINFEGFSKWLSSHHCLLKIFDGCFHQDLWMSGNFEAKTAHSPLVSDSPNVGINQSPLDTQAREVAMSGTLLKKGKKTGGWKPRYYELKGPFLSYYANKDKACLKGVLFLDGCTITELNNLKGNKYGFCINHKNDSYQPHNLYCNNQSEFNDWMSKLRFFNSTSINDFYQIIEEIGTGKFSIVYRGISNKDKKEYAIKAVKKDKLTASEKAAILSETSVMKMLDHPSTIKLIETIEIKNDLYIVMEIVRGGDLFDYVISKEFLEEREASFIMKQLLMSVNHLHNVGIIHRDLKPENIMISRNTDDGKVKEVKIIDFGFAKFLSTNTLMKEACGTPNYLAPEVVKGTGYDKRADVFSLGVIMYFLIRGLLPFDANDVGQILMMTYKSDPPMSDEHWGNISEEGKDLLTKLLHKDPAERIEIEEALKHPWIKFRDSLKKYEGKNPREQDNKKENEQCDNV